MKKYSKYIICEGPDNVGKDTQINLIMKHYSNLSFQKLHYSALPFKGLEQIIKYSNRLYSDMFRMMSFLKKKNINLIFNRSHLGETVYAPLYRGYSGDYVFAIEDKYVESLRENLYLITFVNDPNIILSRDDGKSFYENSEGVAAEVDGFLRAHRKSKIKNKLQINIGNMQPDEIFAIVKNFLDSENKELSSNQLKLEL